MRIGNIFKSVALLFSIISFFVATTAFSITHLMVFAAAMTPTAASAATVTGMGLIPCDGVGCHFDDLILLAANVINYMIFYLALPLSAISFAIAGFMLILAKGNPAKIAGAKAVFGYVAWGFVLSLSAWLIVEAILTGLGLKSAFWILG